MAETTEQERQRAAVEREMQRRREADEREDRDLVDIVGEEHRRGRERDEQEQNREG